MTKVLLILTKFTALATPVFNEDLAKSTVQAWISPITSFLMWGIPLTTMVVCGLAWYKWNTMSEQEQMQAPLGKRISKIIFWAIFMTLIPIIMKIFGL